MGYFSDSGQSLGSGSTQAVALGDLDGDGDLDAFTANASNGSQVWLNDGLGSFSDSGQSLGYNSGRAVTLGDLDGDGDLDALVGAEGDSEIWLNDGSGVFSNEQSLDAYVMALGDLDGDGDLDALGSEVWLNDGSGSFSHQQDLSSGALAVALGDLDGDGDLDAFLSNEVWFNDGSGSFTYTGQHLSEASPYAVALGDLDGDGDLDAFIANYGQMEGGGGGGLGSISQPEGIGLAWAAVRYNSGVRTWTLPMAAIPTLDVLYEHQGNEVWLNNGRGLFDSNGQLLGQANSRAVALGDLDGDGDLDAFIGNDYEEGGDNSDEVWLNQLPLQVTATQPSGNGRVISSTGPILATFSQVMSYSTVTTATFMIRGSQTGLYAGTYTLLDNSVRFEAAQTFKPGETLVADLNVGITSEDGSPLSPYTWQFRAAVSGEAGFLVDSGQRLGQTNSYAVALGDMDGDGDLDAFVGNYDVANQVWWGDGAGHFSDSGQSLGSGYAQTVALGDVDNDGDLDAFVGTAYNGSQVWLNDGAGNFSDSGQSLGSEDNRVVALGDLDGDGDLDAFVGNSDSSQIWLNEGEGNFTAGQTFDYISVNTLALGDLDGDGDLDGLGGGNYGSNYVWLNDSFGHFSSVSLNPDSGNFETRSLALGDLDGDGDLDAFVGQTNPYGEDGRSEVWVNDGTGNFSDSDQSLGNSRVYAIALGDMDGDGDLDALTTHYGQGNRVWLNNGLGGFSSNGQVLGQANSRTVALGDLDSDGDLDAFIGNDYQEGGDNGDEVWLNQIPLQVTATQPSGNGRVISPTAPISVTFNRAFSYSTVTTATFTLRGSQTGLYPGSYTLLDNSAWFSGTQAFKPGETLVANLSTGITAEDGISLTPYAWQFRIAVAAAGSAGAFVDSGQRLANGETTAAALGDLDGDGDLDVLVGNYSGPDTVWLNDNASYPGGDGTGHLSDSGQSLGSGGTNAVVLGDLDGDGDLDGVVGHNDNSQIWLNDGDGVFSAGPTLTSSQSLALGDLDGDLDILAGGAEGGQVWLNDSLGSFSAGQTGLDYAVNTLALGDVDGDGDLDALLSTEGGSHTIWLNDGNGHFSPGQALENVTTRALAMEDLDGDGDLDIFLGGDDNPHAVFLNDGAGHFNKSEQNAGSTTVSTVTTGDVDGDGDLDILTRDEQGANIIWLNDGAGRLSDSGRDLGSSPGRAAALGDLDGDGDLDAFMGNSSTAANEVWLNQVPLRVTATQPSGNGRVISPTEPISATFSRAISSGVVSSRAFTLRGDQTGLYPGTLTPLVDNSVQLSPTQTFKPGETLVANLSRGITSEDGVALTPYVWQFRAPVQAADLPGIFVDSGHGIESPEVSAVALGDLDGDGDLDAFVRTDNGSQVWRNDGSGSFSDSGQLMEAYYGPLALGDLDGDGDLDACLGNGVWLNDGSGIFSAGQSFGEYVGAVALGDVDGDGDLDAFTGAGVWLNNGVAGFSQGQAINDSEGTAVALGDLDGDGDLDAFVYNYEGSNKVWLNSGAGRFSLGQELDSARAFALALGDLDGDGDLDAYVGSYDAEATAVWLNDGTGHFVAGETNPAATYIYSLSLGDVDGDGDLDALVGYEDNIILVRLNDGTGHFSDGQSLDGGTVQAIISLGDLDGDGDLDAFIGNQAYGQASQVWLKQIAPHLTLAKTAPAIVLAGEPITYTLTVTNSGQLTVTNLVITDTLPDQATYITGGVRSGMVVNWTIPALAGESSVQVSYVVTAAATLTPGAYWANAAEGYTATGQLTPATFVLDFGAEPRVGLAPLTVTFTTSASPTEAITTYLWDFGDNFTQTEAITNLITATHTYTTGIYTVSLTALGPGGSATLTRPGFITVLGPRRAWQMITSTLTPPVVGEQAMSYDQDRDVVTLYGGNATGWPYESSTWELNAGLTWITTTLPALPVHYGAAMVYLPTRQEMVLFGGSNADDIPLNQTWIYSNTTWLEVTPAVSPLSRTHASLVAGSTGQIYLFGGNDGLTYFDDLWVYEDGEWLEIPVTGPRPPARTLSALTFQPSNLPTLNRLLLFGGRGSTGQLLADLWSFDLTLGTWSEIEATGPSARQAHALVYDPEDRLLVLIGGTDTNSDAFLAETWYYQDSIGWWPVPSTLTLPGQAYHQAVYDSARHAIILFSNKETWKYE